MSSEIAAALASVQERMATACRRAGRLPREVSLIAVSKTVPLERIQQAHAAGQLDFGENRAQELRDKAPALAQLQPAPRWHFLGPLQSNKINMLLPHIHLLHSLDRLELAEQLNQKLLKRQSSLDVLLQVNTSAESSKSGVSLDQTQRTIAALAEFPQLRLRGLMTIAMPSADEKLVKSCFQALRKQLELANQQLPAEARLSELSMGMSGDFEWAIEEGATLVRVGSAIFGERPQGR